MIRRAPPAIVILASAAVLAPNARAQAPLMLPPPPGTNREAPTPKPSPPRPRPQLTPEQSERAREEGARLQRESELERRLMAGGEEGKAAVEHVLTHPDALNPLMLTALVQSLWQRGDRSRAAFWFYIFQSRTRAWSKADDQFASARAAFNMTLGPPINEWIASDIPAWKALAARAIAYEKTLPLYPGRPDTMDEARWRDLVEQERAAYEREFIDVFSSSMMNPDTYYAQRRGNGLYVGPHRDGGAPLPDHWR